MLSDVMDFSETMTLVEDWDFTTEELAEANIEESETQSNTNELLGVVEPEIPSKPSKSNADDTSEDEASLEEVMTAYVQNAALQTDQDQIGLPDAVQLMTLHSAKGLEFDYVFIVGVEENVFPSYRALESEEQLEEERRLAYVGITRAKKKLYLCAAKRRLLFGQTQMNAVSRFMTEIPEVYVETPLGGLPRRGEYRTQWRGTGHQTGRHHANSAASNTAHIAEHSRTGGRQRRRSFDPNFKRGNKLGGFLSNTPNIPEDEILKAGDIKRGMRVKHARFGEGTVLLVSQQPVMPSWSFALIAKGKSASSPIPRA